MADLETTDPDGRPVVFDFRTREHLRRRHPQMLLYIHRILAAIANPDVRDTDPRPGRERFYRRDRSDGRWLRVVVDFNESPAFVVTAFVQHNPPGTPAI